MTQLADLADKTRLFTAEEYHAMGCAGVFHEDDRLELVDGRIRTMTPIGARHIDCVNRLNRAFASRVPPDVEISVQNPVLLDDLNEPEPDLTLLDPSRDRKHVPFPEDVLLLVEVAESSLDYDRNKKLPRYAAARIPEVWIVALPLERVDVYRAPSATGYDEHTIHRPGNRLDIAALPAAGEFTVEEVLGG